METLVAFIALFATVFGIMYVHYTTRNKERMALIEKGADASLFNTGREGIKWAFNWNKFTLKLGMLFMGIALGIIAGAISLGAGEYVSVCSQRDMEKALLSKEKSDLINELDVL